MKSSVTLIFFNRPDTLKEVFNQVKQAKPPKLFLVQDGPREGNENDIVNIQKCRDVVADIDWACEVFTNYSDVNLGCGVRPQSGITWVLSQVESTIVLEDDCVADLSFFDFCDEMLERYKDDQRISYISGLNHFEEWDFGGSSYGFTKSGAIWGWATWRRAWKSYDYQLDDANDSYVEKIVKKMYPDGDARVAAWKATNELVKDNVKISYWDTQWGFIKYTQNQLVIVPKYNLICNIGVGNTSTHGKQNYVVHKKYHDYNCMPTKALEFPLVHPKHMLCDIEYDDLVYQCNKKTRQRMVLESVKKKVFKR